jgi:hypothetical protein
VLICVYPWLIVAFLCIETRILLELFSYLLSVISVFSVAKDLQVYAALAAPVPAMRPNTAPETSPVPLG